MQPGSPAPLPAGESLDIRRGRLEGLLREMGSVAVGFSGGSDSALLVRLAAEVLGDRAVAVTAVSPSYPERDLREARDLAAGIGIRHLLVDSHEFENPLYIANAPNRCFFCKQELFDLLWGVAKEQGLATVAYGAITDDLADFRPGMDAAKKAGARAPLLEAGFSKQDVRDLSRRLGLPTWDRPASACLSSRIPHGNPISVEELKKVESSEDLLLSLGLKQVRVRSHGEVARIECPPADLPRLAEPGVRETVVARLKALGYRWVTVDLEGYRSGSLNPEETNRPDGAATPPAD